MSEQEVQQTPHHEGEPMTMPVRDFTDEAVRSTLLSELNAAQKDTEVRRTAGTYIHDYAMGLMSYDDVLQVLTDNPDTAHICIDEHCTHPTAEPGAVVVSSHAGCGAAAVVHGMIASGADAGRMAGVLGQEMAEQVKSGALAPDQLGQLWSQKLVSDLQARSVNAVHQHLDVVRYAHHDHKIHSATGAVVSLEPSKQANYVTGAPEEQLFMVTNLRPGEVSDQALAIMAKEAVLAAKIAFGDHGILGDSAYADKQFAIIVNQAAVEGFSQETFDAQLQRFADTLGVDMQRLLVTYHE